MKVLFISSGNKKDGISPIVYNQGESLKSEGVNLDYFTVDGKGFIGYFKNLIPLIKVINKGKYDILHAHYSLCGFLVTIASPFKSHIVVSLMGTLRKSTFKYYLIHFLSRFRWKNIIVKSDRMKRQIGLVDAHIIPNGVSLEKFKCTRTKNDLRRELNISVEKKIIIFVSNPKREEKNFKLCKASVELLNDESVELMPVFNIPHNQVVKYMFLADVLMLTSFTEGSPNVIKEAMVTGCPIVTTNVGDVSFLLQDLPGTFIMKTFSAHEGAELLKSALCFDKRILGLERIKELKLTSIDISKKIIDLYKLDNN